MIGVASASSDAATSTDPPGVSARGLIEAWLDDEPGALSLLSRCATESSGVIHVPFGPTGAYLVTDPELVRQVLVAGGAAVRRDRGFLDSFDELLGGGLITADGPEWRAQRRRVQGAIHRNRALLARASVQLTTRLVGRWSTGEVRDVSAELADLHWRILTSSVLGHAADELPPVCARPADAGAAADLGCSWEPGWLDVRGALPDRRRIEDRARSADVATLLCTADGAGLSDGDLRAELITLLFAGRDTTTSALTWILIALAQHPDVQARLREELRTSLDPDALAANVLQELRYLHRVITEALRLYPPTAFITREPRENIELGGYRIAAGSVLVLSPWVTHRDARVFADPLVFDPDRWEREHSAPGLTYFPFGAGPRMCVGRSAAMTEIALVVAMLLRRVEVEIAGAPPVPRLRATLTTADPVRMRIARVVG